MFELVEFVDEFKFKGFNFFKGLLDFWVYENLIYILVEVVQDLINALVEVIKDLIYVLVEVVVFMVFAGDVLFFESFILVVLIVD